MARIRSVTPGICTSETMASLSAEVERTFVRLWTHLDDEGRCVDHPKLIKAALFPLHDEVTAAVVDAHLAELEQAGCLVRHESAGQRYLAVPSWGQHQHPQKARPSTIPPPPEGPLPDESDTTTRPLPDEYGPVVGVGEGDGEGVGEVTPSPPSASLALVPASASSPAVTASTNGNGRYPAAFEAWWARYPRKVGKGDAHRAWRKACKRAGSELLDHAVEAHVAAWEANGDDPRFIPHPSTWLNGERYFDPPPSITGPRPRAGPSSRSERNMANIEASVARMANGSAS